MRISVLVVSICVLLSFNSKAQNKAPKYKNSSLPIGERVDDLLSRLTTEEKVAQLLCFMSDFDPSKISKHGLGNMASVFGKYSPEEAAKKHNEMQMAYQKNTRLGIPVLFHGEAVFGLMANGRTSFPQPIA